MTIFSKTFLVGISIMSEAILETNLYKGFHEDIRPVFPVMSLLKASDISRKKRTDGVADTVLIKEEQSQEEDDTKRSKGNINFKGVRTSAEPFIIKENWGRVSVYLFLKDKEGVISAFHANGISTTYAVIQRRST